MAEYVMERGAGRRRRRSERVREIGGGSKVGSKERDYCNGVRMLRYLTETLRYAVVQCKKAVALISVSVDVTVQGQQIP